jgi:hypothetical protein
MRLVPSLLPQAYRTSRMAVEMQRIPEVHAAAASAIYFASTSASLYLSAWNSLGKNMVFHSVHKGIVPCPVACEIS